MTDYTEGLPVCGYPRDSEGACCRPVAFEWMRCYYHRGEAGDARSAESEAAERK